MTPEQYGLIIKIKGSSIPGERTTNFAKLTGMLYNLPEGSYELRHFFNGEPVKRFDLKGFFLNDIGAHRVVTESGAFVEQLLAIPNEKDNTLTTFGDNLKSPESFAKQELDRAIKLIEESEERKPKEVK